MHTDDVKLQVNLSFCVDKVAYDVEFIIIFRIAIVYRHDHAKYIISLGWLNQLRICKLLLFAINICFIYVYTKGQPKQIISHNCNWCITIIRATMASY